MNSEREIISKLFESCNDDLDERTYIVGDTQYWRRGSKTYKWTQSQGKSECSEEEYIRAMSSNNVTPNDDILKDPSKRKRPDIVSPELSKHLDKENSRMDSFLRSEGYDKYGGKSIEMANGQVIEKYNHKGIKSYLHLSYDDSTLFDTSIYCRYNDGSVKIYSDGDYVGHIKTNGLVSYIEDNSATTVIYGDVSVENWNDVLAGERMTRYGTSEDEDDWRAIDNIDKKD